MFINEKVTDYINVVDSINPTPGGGSVIALVGAVASGLARMYAHLTFDKKAYAKHALETRDNFEQSFSQLLTIKEKMIVAIDEDALVYTRVIQAYRLPKETTAEIETRLAAIQVATLAAISVPQRVMLAAYDGLCLLENLIPFGNKNAVSDIIIAIHLFACVVECSIINMKINIAVLTDEAIISQYNAEIADLLTNTLTKKELLIELSNQFL